MNKCISDARGGVEEERQVQFGMKQVRVKRLSPRPGCGWWRCHQWKAWEPVPSGAAVFHGSPVATTIRGKSRYVRASALACLWGSLEMIISGNEVVTSLRCHNLRYTVTASLYWLKPVVLNWRWLCPQETCDNVYRWFLVVSMGGGECWGQWVEAGDAANWPAMHRTNHNKEWPAQMSAVLTYTVPD